MIYREAALREENRIQDIYMLDIIPYVVSYR